MKDGALERYVPQLAIGNEKILWVGPVHVLSLTVENCDAREAESLRDPV